MGAGLRSAFRPTAGRVRPICPLQCVDEPPIVIEFVAQPDVEGARVAAVLQVSLWREDQAENSL